MRVLIACEYSGRVRDAFRKNGHDAWSCDLRRSQSDQAYHYQCDVAGVLDDGWDLMIAFPPCTHLANVGAPYFVFKQDEQSAAVDFVAALWNAPIPRIAIENPVGYLNTHWPGDPWRRPDQIINPYQFGDPWKKRTCLWLKNLPELQPTRIVHAPRSWTDAVRDGKDRALTFNGIAQAMANQWGPNDTRCTMPTESLRTF